MYVIYYSWLGFSFETNFPNVILLIKEAIFESFTLKFVDNMEDASRVSVFEA